MSFQEDVPQVEIRVNLGAAQRFGIKPGDVRRAAATLMSGEEVGDIFRGGRAYDVNVWSTPGNRDSVSDIGRLLLDTPGGGRVRLGSGGGRPGAADARTRSNARPTRGGSTSKPTWRAVTWVPS